MSDIIVEERRYSWSSIADHIRKKARKVATKSLKHDPEANFQCYD